MQIAIIEFARHVCGLKGAHSKEIDAKTPYPVIDFLPGQNEYSMLGGTLRLGKYPCKLKPGTKAHEAYGFDMIEERHRHRYEVNNDYRDVLVKNGLTLSGMSPDGLLVETSELTDRPFYVGVQYHPEFKSRPNKPHPLFLEFVGAALQKSGIQS